MDPASKFTYAWAEMRLWARALALKAKSLTPIPRNPDKKPDKVP